MKSELRIFALAVALCACGSRVRVDADSGSAALMRNLLNAGTVEVVVRAGPALEPVRRATSRFTRAGCALRIATGDAHLPRIVLGCRADAGARSLVESMGVKTGETAGQPWFVIDETGFGAPDDALVACFEDPERPGLPLTLYYANDEEHLGRLATHELAPGWKPSLCVWSGGREVLRGPLPLAGRIDPVRLVRSAKPEGEPLTQRTDGITGTTQKGIEAARLSALLDEVARARVALHAWAAPASALPGIELAAYARAEDYTRVAGSAEAASVDPLTRRVHACLAPGMPAAGAAAAARATGRKLLGECALPWLEDGAAVDAAGRWWGEDLDSWLAWITARGLVLPLERLLDPRADESESPHLLLPLRAALFRVLRESSGDEELRALWTGAHAFKPDATLPQAFVQALAARVAAAPAGLATRRGPGFPQLDANGRQAWRGVEGEPTLGGESWASEPGTRSVALAQALGANAFGLRISLAARSNPLALPDPVHPRRMGTREGDLQIWAALAAARERKMATFLDVDVLATPSGVEDGAWARAVPAQWERFFAARSAALTHAGLLAQLGHVDLLSIGSELSTVTRDQIEGRKGQQADLDAKRAGWAAVIARTRASFEGALTYSATFTELPLVLFWKDLDAIGYRLDTPLRAGFGNSIAEHRTLVQQMQSTLEQVAAVASKQGKPWFLVRSGFEPTLAAPGAPRTGAGAADPNGIRVQLEALGGVIQALSPSARPAASFLWRWPSDPEERPLDPRDVLLPRTQTLEALRDLWRVL